MTEAEWLACADPTPMLEFLWGKVSDRKLRLFLCACGRRAWPLLRDERSRHAVEVAERYAECLADVEELWAAERAALGAWQNNTSLNNPWFAAARTASNAAAGAGVEDEGHFFGAAITVTVDAEDAKSPDIELPGPCRLLRDIFANPFRPLPHLPPAVLAWNDRTVPRLAEAIYDNRKMPEGTLDNSRMAILADALLDAGCDDEALIQHCRSEGQHVRGCCAVDLILEKG
jgi:hypothetical protein